MNRCCSRGVSLVELAVALAVLAVVVAIALPSFTTLVADARIRSTTESLRSGLQLARMEALKRGSGIFFSMANLDSSWVIGCENPIADDNDGDGMSDCPAQIQFSARTASGGTDSITITPDAGTLVTFSPLGIVRQVNLDGSVPFTQVDVTAPNIDQATIRPLRVLLLGGGLSRVCDPSITTPGDTRKC